jgi:hypothetical protein
MRLAVVAVFAAFVLSGCASWWQPAPETSNIVRTRAPVNYETTIANYFDFNVVDDPSQRKLVFAAPEASTCALFGGAGSHQGFVVPVIYDTTLRTKPAAAAPAPAPTVQAAAPASGKNAKAPAKNAKNAKTPAPAITTSGTGAEPAPAIAPTMTLKDVSITGNRYFFWFSNETISAVTRRMDLCP